jgi:hypothetical protein
MPKKTTLLLIFLGVVTLMLLFLALVSTRTPGPSTKLPEEKPVEKTAKVYFNPQSINLTATEGAVEIMVDTGGSDITGVQAELQYDPKSLANVKLLPKVDDDGFFGSRAVVLFNEVIPATGRISYVIAINTGEATRKGAGKIATLTFSKAQTATTSTQINFLDKTLVTKLGVEESVLKESTPLSITIDTGSQITGPRTSSTPTQ